MPSKKDPTETCVPQKAYHHAPHLCSSQQAIDSAKKITNNVKIQNNTIRRQNNKNRTEIFQQRTNVQSSVPSIKLSSVADIQNE